MVKICNQISNVRKINEIVFITNVYKSNVYCINQTLQNTEQLEHNKTL